MLIIENYKVFIIKFIKHFFSIYKCAFQLCECQVQKNIPKLLLVMFLNLPFFIFNIIINSDSFSVIFRWTFPRIIFLAFKSNWYFPIFNFDFVINCFLKKIFIFSINFEILIGNLSKTRRLLISLL